MTLPEPGPSDPKLPPKPRPSWLAIGYGAFGAIVLGAYVLAGFFGWHFFDAARDQVPASVRHSPGGYRSYGFWHSGYQGGK